MSRHPTVLTAPPPAPIASPRSFSGAARVPGRPAARDVRPKGRRGGPSNVLFVNPRILAALSYAHFATDLPQGAVPALLPLFKTQYHLSYVQLGFIVLLSNISSSVIQPLFGIISDRTGIAWMMPVGTLLAGLGMMATVVTHSYTVVVVMIFIAGIGVAAFHPEGYKFAGLASYE